MTSSIFSWGPSYNEVIRDAEKNLLDSIPWGDAEYSMLDVPITLGDEAHHIHTIVASHPASEASIDIEPCPIVLWHGFGQGAGSYWRCLPGLAKSHASQGNVYALDWIGVGASSRPKWTAGDNPALAEEWFVDTLEKWRLHQGYNRIHLVAHSMAAFIATRYAEKYPNRLASLVYASPAGVPHVPEDYNFNPPRLTQSITGRMALWTARHLWTNGTTPQGVVRSLGRWVGKGYVIDGYVKRRFPDSVPNKDEFAEYMYQHWQGESSGEQILNALLRFGAHAKVCWSTVC
jgi:cardiolipin-specific phospholipase